MTRLLMVAALAAAVIVPAAAPAAAPAKVRWLCRPGTTHDPCDVSLRTTVEAKDGSSRVVHPRRAAHPGIDCFYVYPTVSGQPTVNATKARDPEIRAIAQYQAAPFSRDCRVFTPLYRQLTLKALTGTPPQQVAAGARIAYRDVRQAWRNYLRHHNRGRGVVLIGHSQGSFMLRKLVRDEIDRHPSVRRRLVSAVLLGGNVLVRRGRDAGGDFRRVRACRSRRQTGCVIAYSTYNATPPDNTLFGRPTAVGLAPGLPSGSRYQVLCTNPASLAHNHRRQLTPLIRTKPFPGALGLGTSILYGGAVPTASTPWLQPPDRYAARCVTRNHATVLNVRGVDGAQPLHASPDASWGLHLADVNLTLNRLVGDVRSQARAWREQHPSGA
jgi:DUF3089 family protein